MTQYNTATGQIEEADDAPQTDAEALTAARRYARGLEARMEKLEQCLRYCIKELNEWRDAYPLTLGERFTQALELPYPPSVNNFKMVVFMKNHG